MINFDEGAVRVNGHINLGNAPMLAQGEWTGRNLDDMNEDELRAVLDRMLVLCNQKFSREG